MHRLPADVWLRLLLVACTTSLQFNYFNLRRTSNMKTKTALLAMGLFTLAGAVTVSCGGSSDENGGNGSTRGRD